MMIVSPDSTTVSAVACVKPRGSFDRHHCDPTCVSDGVLAQRFPDDDRLRGRLEHRETALEFGVVHHSSPYEMSHPSPMSNTGRTTRSTHGISNRRVHDRTDRPGSFLERSGRSGTRDRGLRALGTTSTVCTRQSATARPSSTRTATVSTSPPRQRWIGLGLHPFYVFNTRPPAHHTG